MSFDPVTVTLGLLCLVSFVIFGLTLTKPTAYEDPTSCATWEITVPRSARFSVAQARAWFTSLTPLLAASPAAITVELVGHRHELHLHLTAPVAWEAALRAQLAARFPAARLEAVTSASRETVRDYLHLEKPEVFVLHVAEDGERDPLLGVLGALTHADYDCGLRLTWRREPSNWQAWSERTFAAMEAGSVVLPRHWPGWLRLAGELVHHGLKRSASLPPTPTVIAAAEKLRDSVFEAQVSVWADGEPEVARRFVSEVAAQVTTGYRNPFGNTFITDTADSTPKHPRPTSRGPWYALSALELASLFHLPYSDHPLILTEPRRQAAPIADLRRDLGVGGGSRTVVGEVLLPNGLELVSLGLEERRLHVYVIGKTGTGKSTFLANLARQDLAHGHGFALVDPHGDLAEQVLAMIPPERWDDVLYFNAADTAYPVGFNLLATRTPAERPLVASGVVGVFKKLYGDSWGPRLEHFLRNSILTLLESPSPSLLLLPRLLTDKGMRQQVLSHVRDPLLRSFFLEEYERYDTRWRAEAISPILNKVGQFLSAPAVRHIVGQSGPGFNLREVMDQRGIFIANLASGRIGEDNCNLLGGLLVAGFQVAAMSRANQPEGERQDFFLSVDEFQRFSNDAFTSILSEARKYRLALTLGHQYLDQVPVEISEAVFGNVGSLVAFRVGAGDVGRLEREFAPVFDGQDLVHLPNHHFCARLPQRTGTAPAFSGRTLPPPPFRAVAAELLERSRIRWARPQAEVELEILDTWDGRLW